MQYRFGDFLLDPAARLLQRESIGLDAPRKVFDCLVYLIEHRERAIGRDELVRALWRHDNVSDNRLAQVVAAVRRLVDDDGNAQRLIRTVPGFGYHWIGPLDVVAASDDGSATAPSADSAAAAAAPPGDTPPPEAACSEPAATPAAAPAILPAPDARAVAPPTAARHARWAATLALLLVMLLVGVWWQAPVEDTPLGGNDKVMPTTGQVWVLPAALPDESEAWARVGLMALVGEGLRRAGLVVVPVEKVLARIHEPVPDGHLAKLRSELDAAGVVAPRVHRVGDGWAVELVAATKPDGSVRVDASDSDLTTATRLAVSRLKQRLQRGGAELDGSIGETFTVIEQTIRARDFEGALLQLSRLSPQAREMPEAGLLEIDLDLEKGRYASARDKADYWLERLDRTTRPVPYARTLLRKAAALRQLDETGWVPLVDEALALLENAASPRDLAIAVQLHGIAAIIADRQADAARDLARARELFTAAGDELRAARVTSTMAQQAQLQGRHLEALTLLEQSDRVLGAYGAIGPLLTNARWTAFIHIELSRWSDVLRVTDGMRPLLQAGGGASSYEQYTYLRLRTWALMELGRLKEAEALLDEQVHHVQREGADNPVGDGTRMEQIEIAKQRARLRLMQGRWEEARSAAKQGLALIGAAKVLRETRQDRNDVEALLLLLTRAQAGAAPWSPQAPVPRLAPTQLQALRAAQLSDGVLARAYWSARRGDSSAAEADYRAVLAMERVQRSPLELLAATDAYVGFLLSQGRLPDASREFDQLEALAPGVTERNYDAALTLLRVRLAEGDRARVQAAARTVLALIGEREPPADLRTVLASDRASATTPGS